MHFYINPRIQIQNSSCHGIDEKLYKNLSPSDLDEEKNFKNFLNFIGDSLIVSHNPLSDIIFINKELELLGLNTIDPKRFRCTMRIYYNRFKSTAQSRYLNLGFCCKTFHISCNNNHAEDDCRSTAELLIKLMNKNKKKYF